MKAHQAMPVYAIGIAQFTATARNFGRANPVNDGIELLFWSCHPQFL